MRKHIGVAIACAVMTACGGGHSGESEPAFGAITLGVTDAPVDGAEHVVVEFTGVELKARGEAGPEVFDFTQPRQIDLLALEGGGSEILLEDEVVPAGEYEWLRLKVNAGRTASDSYVDLADGSRHALFIPSGNQSGLKLIRGFTVGAGNTTAFTIDFDLRRSVIRPPGQAGQFLLKPVLRLVNNLEVGTLSGSVEPELIDAACTPAVYVFRGSAIEPDDLGSENEPLVTARVQQNQATGGFEYRIGFVPVDSYTAALTCEADIDDAETDDAIEFLDAIDAEVKRGETTVVDFTAESSET